MLDKMEQEHLHYYYSNSFPHPTHQIAEPMNLNTTSSLLIGTQDGTTNSDFNEDGLALLGVIRGRIGAFYEREIEVDTDLVALLPLLQRLAILPKNLMVAGAKLEQKVLHVFL